eukprot:TRINITY_DN4609_c0_g1_i3.p1 TRINITY_DN4609_c0_g1~~TRINITY_DN4609_c0_g1_i3.p1  ORF type:complete len:499 (-),score=98.95 TRINITY_DN4609_c0_g1_i3:145-1641(-)
MSAAAAAAGRIPGRSRQRRLATLVSVAAVLATATLLASSQSVCATIGLAASPEGGGAVAATAAATAAADAALPPPEPYPLFFAGTASRQMADGGISAGDTPAAAEPAPTVLTLSPAVATTYIFFTHFWWEMFHNQLTTLTTGLAVAKLYPNAVVVLPPAVGVPARLPSPGGMSRHTSLFGDYYDLPKLKAVQRVMTLDEFLAPGSQTAAALATVPTGTLQLPKASQEDYEKALSLLGDLSDTRISVPLPHEDLERTEQYCDSLPGSVYPVPVASGGLSTFQLVFFDRLHFFHFCTEKFVPWWYDVRQHVQPRPEYFAAVSAWRATITGPVTVIHLRDLMDGQRERDEEDVQRYARQVVEALRQTPGGGAVRSVGVQANLAAGSLYLSYPPSGKNVGRVASLFREEFPRVYTCADVHECGAGVTAAMVGVGSSDVESLFQSPHAATVMETALSMSADHFVGNVYSSYSRNVGLWRKMHGKSYTIVKGFGEMRRIWTWQL